MRTASEGVRGLGSRQRKLGPSLPQTIFGVVSNKDDTLSDRWVCIKVHKIILPFTRKVSSLLCGDWWALHVCVFVFRWNVWNPETPALQMIPTSYTKTFWFLYRIYSKAKLLENHTLHSGTYDSTGMGSCLEDVVYRRREEGYIVSV